MENEELKGILGRLPIPEPGEEAKNKAIQSALVEFRLQAEKEEKQFKGFMWLDRLMSKKSKGGFFMNRTIAISTAGIAVSVIIFAIVYSPTIISEIQRNYAPVAKQELTVQKQEPYPAKPAESTAVTQMDQKEAQPVQEAKKEAADADASSNLETIGPVITAKSITERVKNDIADKASPAESGTATQQLMVLSQAAKGKETEVNTDNVRINVVPYNEPAEVTGKKEFPLEDITVTSQKREENQQKVPIEKALSITKAAIDNLISLRGQEGGGAIINPEYVGRDKFEDINANTVKLVSEEPVSTFSIDVDTASYAFVRRALNNGYLPQKNAVRIEEMINYFDYDYPLPKDKSEPFKPTAAVFQTPWNANTKLLHIGIKGYNILPAKKPKVNLVFLIDVSGSMQSDDKLPLLKNSLRMLVETLNPDDTVAIAVYAGAAGTVLERTKVSEKSKILAAIDRLHAGGSTAGGEGIKLAYSLAEADMDPQCVNRVILATDGDFNVGITNPDVLNDFVERKRKSGVYLSVLGFGQGNYNDALMQKLAQNGNGNASYIDNLNEARKVLVDEAYGTLFTIAKDVKIQIEFNPSMISEYRLIGYETRILNREDFKNDNVDAGDIGSGHSVTAIYEITPRGSKGQLIEDLRYGSNKTSERVKTTVDTSEYAFLKIRYKLPEETSSREITTSIDKGNEYIKISDAPGDSRFAAAVAAFGQILRGDSHINQFTYDNVITLAHDSIKDDPFGYRTEFLNLVRLAKTASPMGNR